MRWLLLAVSVSVSYDVATQGLMRARPGSLFVVLVTAVVAYEFARSRDETGLAGATGDTLLLELRDRLQQQGRLPALPGGWHGEVVVRPAGGAPFAGDFVVSSLTAGGRTLELALVDVSGKGIEAATRALLLSGALGGLLGSLRPEEFLPAANRYLDRQDWDEGFATAVHLVVDTHSGDYAVESAGHPPVAHFDASSGRVVAAAAEGFALGPGADGLRTRAPGRLDRGDALLLYTDGLWRSRAPRPSWASTSCWRGRAAGAAGLRGGADCWCRVAGAATTTAASCCWRRLTAWGSRATGAGPSQLAGRSRSSPAAAR
jgi:hypothetical protein